MAVRYNLSSVWVRLSILSQLLVMHYTICGAVCFQFTHFLCDDWENIYILCLIIIIKSEVWTNTHCWGLGYETMVCAVCLYIFLVKGTTVTARFVTRFNLWLRHDLWPQNASICDPARFVTKSASICDQRYTMILESKLCRGKLVFVFTLIMNATWYNMMHIYIWTVL